MLEEVEYGAELFSGTSAEQQDIASAKIVWKGYAGTGQQYTLLIMRIPVEAQSRESVLAQACKDFVTKIRADGAIWWASSDA